MTPTSSTHLIDRVREALAPSPPVREVRMFGGVAFMVREQMVVWVGGDGGLLVRADPEQADALLTVRGARSAEMGAGRAMSKGWISVGEVGIATDDDLDFWIGVALEHNARRATTSNRSRPRKKAQ